MPKRYQPEDFDKIFEEMAGQNDRAVISVGGSMVEYALERVIAIRLREPAGNAESKVLFGEQGVIGSFYQKIWMAYFLKIVGPLARRDLDLVRKIRNQAAHDMNPVSFEDSPEVASRCCQLTLVKEVYAGKSPSLREMFIYTTQYFTANLLMRGGDEEAEVHAAFAGMAPYLDR